MVGHGRTKEDGRRMTSRSGSERLDGALGQHAGHGGAGGAGQGEQGEDGERCGQEPTAPQGQPLRAGGDNAMDLESRVPFGLGQKGPSASLLVVA